jgi:hypothetical protein
MGGVVPGLSFAGEPMKTVRIRIIAVPSDGWNVTRHPVKNRLIALGDEFEVQVNHDSSYATWKSIDTRDYWVSESFFEIVDLPATHTCTCALHTLMSHGCQCGGT